MKSHNVYGVEREEWEQWSEVARRVFNEVYTAMATNQDLFLGAASMDLQQWEVTSWKAAWIAAHAADDRLG